LQKDSSQYGTIIVSVNLLLYDDHGKGLGCHGVMRIVSANLAQLAYGA
jgi:hypothetical protein